MELTTRIQDLDKAVCGLGKHMNPSVPLPAMGK